MKLSYFKNLENQNYHFIWLLTLCPLHKTKLTGDIFFLFYLENITSNSEFQFFPTPFPIFPIIGLRTVLDNIEVPILGNGLRCYRPTHLQIC